MTQTICISGTYKHFAKMLGEYTQNGWTVQHFDTLWANYQYYNDQDVMYSAILVKPES